jgi:hypothetical protein
MLLLVILIKKSVLEFLYNLLLLNFNYHYIGNMGTYVYLTLINNKKYLSKFPLRFEENLIQLVILFYQFIQQLIYVVGFSIIKVAF